MKEITEMKSSVFAAGFFAAMFPAFAFAACVNNFETINATSADTYVDTNLYHTRNITSADNGCTFLFSSSAGSMAFKLPAPSTFGAGFVRFKKTDSTLGLAQVEVDSSVSPPFTLELGFRVLPIAPEGAAVEMFSDGNNWWTFPGLASIRNAPFPAEHVVADPSKSTYLLIPDYDGFAIYVDTYSVGSNTAIELPHVSDCVPTATHQTCIFFVKKQDSQSSPYIVRLISQAGEAIADPRARPVGYSGPGCNDSTPGCEVDITVNGSSVLVYTNGASTWYIMAMNNLGP